MFGRKKMYKKGLADAMQAYEAFGKKQQGSLEKIVQDFKSSNKELDMRLKALGEDIIAVYDYLDRHEKAALYKLCTPMDLKELEDSERRLLIAVLCQLADDEGSRYNSDQRKFVNSIRRYLEIPNVQTFADYSAIEEIDSLDVQETFMRVCLEFMYLQDADEMSDEQEEFFDNFSVSKRQAKLIEFDVIRQFHMFGAEGVAEKYGNEMNFDSTTINDEVDVEDVNNTVDVPPTSEKVVEPYIGVPLDIAEKICVKKQNYNSKFKEQTFFETKDFLVYFEEDKHNASKSKWYRVNKKDKSITVFASLPSNIQAMYTFQHNYDDFKINGLNKGYVIIYSKNLVYYIDQGKLNKIDVSTDEKYVFSKFKETGNSLYYHDGVIVSGSSEKLLVINLLSESTFTVKDAVGKNITATEGKIAVISDKIIFSSEKGRELTADDGGSLAECICAYNIKNGSLARILELKDFPNSPSYISAVFAVHGELYVVCDWRFDKFLFYHLTYDGDNYKAENLIDYPFGCQLQLYYNFLAYYNPNGQTFPIYVYDFEKKTNTKIIDRCRTFEDEGFFKPKLKDRESGFKMIGQWLYFLRGYICYNDSSRSSTIGNDVYRVNVNTPMKDVNVGKAYT